MDDRICPTCHGAGWYYRETPGRNKPIEAALVECPHTMQHMQRITVAVPAPASDESGVFA